MTLIERPIKAFGEFCRINTFFFQINDIIESTLNNYIGRNPYFLAIYLIFSILDLSRCVINANRHFQNISML